MYLTFDSVKNLDGSQNTCRLKPGSVQGYHHMTELLIKTARAVF